MNLETIAILATVFIVVLVVLAIYLRKVPKKLKVDSYADQWKQLQGYCKDKKTWSTAIIEADTLLDKALKCRKYKGKRMGERMVAAQRKFTNNDAVWFAHNLCKKIIADPDVRLKEQDVKSALLGFRQALRDLGALETGEAKKGEA